MNRLMLLVTGLIGLSLVWSLPGHTYQNKPEYDLVPCCDYCEKVKHPEFYTTSYLKNFSMLLKGKENWLFRSEKELTTEFGPEAEARRRLRVFSDRLRQHGTQLVMILPPTRGLVHPDKIPQDYYFDFTTASDNYRHMVANLRAEGIVIPDLSPLFAEEPSDKEFFFRRDHHWSPWGAQRTAKMVAEEVKKHPRYAALDKTEFESKQIGLMRKRGSLQVAWYRICDTRFANQYVPEFRTEPKMDSGELDESSLFGDEGSDLPPVTLVGTSYSKGAAEYNFSGFLKEFLQLDVLNEAMAGGSYDGAMVQYLPSKDFQNNPPAFLFWEIPSYHKLNSEIFYRQINGYMENGCRNKKAEFKQTTDLLKGNGEILFNGGDVYQEFRGKGRILDVQFSEPHVKKFKAEIWYTNGRKERVKIEHSKRVDNQGRFVFFLQEENGWDDYNLLSVKLLGLDNMPYSASVTASACWSQYQ
ncbi:Alginate biosynthesis protein AlgX [Thalassocella blandensis]|nr:Alginate biosynthesis protein AlgX [Thalassocella blandensis]